MQQVEPIAIIGAGCRFPAGADTPVNFWHLLHNGIDAVTEIPSSECKTLVNFYAQTNGSDLLKCF